MRLMLTRSIPLLCRPLAAGDKPRHTPLKISAFLQLYNEHSSGHLRRCLDNCSRWADSIYIYDDCSTDGSREVYREYTDASRVILGQDRAFNREIFHKQELLDLVKRENCTDWIAWIDGDAVFDRVLTERMRLVLENLDVHGFDSASVHYLNLWRSESHYRLDSGFNKLNPICFWKLSPDLHYDPADGLHRDQFPLGLQKTVHLPHNFLHYGFASREGIARKYLTYKRLGGEGRSLDRLIDEDGLKLAEVPAELYPDGCLPAGHPGGLIPVAMSYDDVRGME